MLDTKIGQLFIKLFILLSVTICTIVTVSLFLFLIYNGLKAFNLKFLNMMLPALIATVYLVITTLVLVLPVGILSAIYLKVYAKENFFSKIISFAINCLAAMPSIVYGLFAVSLFLYFFRVERSILIASITIACLILPIIIKNVEDAIENVPILEIEASYALGATIFDTIKNVILPYTQNNIITSVSLSIGRIVGDVAAIMFVLGTIDRIPNSIFDSGISLATKLYLILQEPAFSKIGIAEAYAIALLLIIFVIILNVIARYFDRNIKEY